MQQIFKKIARNIKSIYHKAEDLIEEERELPLSQNLLNATIQKYVTDNVTALQDLHACSCWTEKRLLRVKASQLSGWWVRREHNSVSTLFTK